VFAVRCELLQGSFQAADPFGSAEAVEWPPHPYRLHAALVAAACEAGGERPIEDDVAALRWLEAQRPPVIACSREPSRRTTATMWVPRNPTRGGEWARYMKAGRIDRVGRVLPTAVPEDPVVVFSWPESDPPPAALATLVEGVAWLGSSRSPVACAIVEEAPDAVFLPSRQGHRQVRVAAPGITEALLAARFTHPQPVSAPIAGYATGATPRLSPRRIRRAPFSELLVRRVVAAMQDSADSAIVAAALRAAVLGRAGDSAPPALHGHDPARGHGAYLTLCDVAHKAARGTVRGVALALPDDVSAGEREACERAFAAVDPLALGDGRTPLRLDDEVADLWTLSPDRWVGPARAWASVTPVVLDRFPRRARTARDELLTSIANAGLPEPAEAELLAGPPLAGAPPGGALRGEVPAGMRVHARVRFPEPVRGPVLVGRGRFRGVGLFLPERSP
jgi:CRISPR-associated protein Csb2